MSVKMGEEEEVAQGSEDLRIVLQIKRIEKDKKVGDLSDVDQEQNYGIYKSFCLEF